MSVNMSGGRIWFVAGRGEFKNVLNQPFHPVRTVQNEIQ